MSDDPLANYFSSRAPAKKPAKQKPAENAPKTASAAAPAARKAAPAPASDRPALVNLSKEKDKPSGPKAAEEEALAAQSSWGSTNTNPRQQGAKKQAQFPALGEEKKAKPKKKKETSAAVDSNIYNALK